MSKEPNHAIIICTKNRSQSLLRLLGSIKTNLVLAPDKIVVVDSSEAEIFEVTKDNLKSFHPDVIHLKSASGLPYQRNRGIEFLFERLNYEGDFITFFDDDVEPQGDYLRQVESVFAISDDVILVGGIDLNPGQPKANVWRRITFLDSKKRGSITRGGFASLAVPAKNLLVETVEWVPGYAQTYRSFVLRTLRFEESVRMYGEDVEMHLRASKFGLIVVSPLVRVLHHGVTAGKDAIASVARFSDGFRWYLALTYPNRFNKFAVILSTVVLIFGHALMGILGFKNQFQHVKGHLLFFITIIRKAEARQLREGGSDAVKI